MQTLSENQSQNNNPVPQITLNTLSFKQRYDNLTEGQKAHVLRKYKALYGSVATFYRKIKEEVRVWNSEKIFFENNL
jgi:hypothetical protein